MGRKPTIPPLTPAQARYALERLIDQRKVTAADVRSAIGAMWKVMTALEKHIAELRAVVEPASHPIRAARKASAKIKKAISKAMSPERRESMQLQGIYLQLLRKSPKSARARFKKVAKDRGREEAISAMEKALGE